MVARNRWIGLVGGGVVLVALGAGCGGSSTKDDPYRLEIVKPRISESTLVEHGLETLWYFPPDPVDTPVYMVTLLSDGLFVTTQPTPEKKGRLKRFDRVSGTAAWHFALEQTLSDPPTVYRYPRGTAGASDEVYFSQLDKVHCVDLKYGAELWSAEVNHSISTSVVATELSYFFGSDNGRAYGFRKGGSVEEWTYRTDGTIEASPAVMDTSVFFASTDGGVYRLFSVQPGWIVGSSWDRRTGGRVLADPVVYSRWVLVGSTDYKLYCLEAQDGAVFWSFPAEAPIEETPVVYSYQTNQEYAYCVTVERTPGSITRTCFALRLRDGRELWRRTGIRRVVSMGRNHLYTINDPKKGEERALIALDILTGAERFRISLKGFDYVPTNAADYGRAATERGKIYLVARDGTIQVLSERM